MGTKLQQLLLVAFPPETDREITRGVTEGIILADDLIENTPLLRHGGGGDLRGHIRRSGIMFRLRDLCIRGDLPFAAEIVAMPHGPWHWLEIRSAGFKAHVCRTDGPYKFPDDTQSRQDERLRNSPDLFSEKISDLSETIKRIKEFYAWLTFGVGQHGVLEHLCWTMPPADEGNWLAHRDILHHLAIAAPTQPGQQPESHPAHASPPKSLTLRFKEHIEEALSKEKKDDEKPN
jgi:hypothetical protein